MTTQAYMNEGEQYLWKGDGSMDTRCVMVEEVVRNEVVSGAGGV